MRVRSTSSLWQAYGCFLVLVVAMGWGIGGAFAQQTAPVYDYLIRNGRIVDGTGSPWYQADVAIRNGQIVKIGRLEAGSAREVVDATGLVVAPGFIDMMGQTATPMLDQPSAAINMLTQGITTINAGEGTSAAPLSESDGRRRGWETMSEYFQMLDLKGLPVNAVQTIGHTQVRQMVLGEDNRRPSEDELRRMKALVREAMEAGAIGVSTALIYPPAVYANTEEIGALVEVAGTFGGRYYTHMRNEGDQLLEAIDEALEIGKRGNAPVHIFHLKAAGRQNWGKMPLAIARIRAARASGQEVTADIYPYINNGLGIDALIHPRHFGEGREKFLNRLKTDEELRATVRKEMETGEGWENWYRHAGKDWNRIIIGQTNEPRYRSWVGQSVQSIADQAGEDVWDTFFQLCIAGSFALPETMSEANKILAMNQDFVSFCTDVGPAGGGGYASHPRAYGAFPRLLSRYVGQLGSLSLERAVAQASATAANSLMIRDRGRLAEGLAADVIVFDPSTVTDHADFANPSALSEGMLHVWVNGQRVLEDGKYNGQRPGRMIRGPGYDPQRSASHRQISGQPVPFLSEIDRVMVQYLEDHKIPGASIAVSDRGQVVYARGFGFADVATGSVVEPDSLFRIASISKPITAVAIMQLVQDGKLDLDTAVFEVLDYEPILEEGSTYDTRQDSITIRHLLQHRGGWDRDQSFDAMFQAVPFAQLAGSPPPAGPDQIIRVMLGKRLDFDPGHRYAYSNYGYCLLGRVIEKLTGQTYEAYVKQHVLEPAGISDMKIGATLLEGRSENEVRYYHPDAGTSVFHGNLNQMVPSPYGAWHLEAMDSHGAWIGSASDLVRFASALDDPQHSPLLNAQSIQALWERPEGLAGHGPGGNPKDRYYGLGWSVVEKDGQLESVSHSGSLPGTNTYLLRRPDGRHLAILFNTRVTAKTNRVVNDVLPELLKILDNAQWPTPNP